MTGAGTVYVYSAITGERLLTINDPRPFQDDQFGFSVAILEGKIIVGAPGARNPNVPVSPPVVGVVYVFDGATGELLQTLTAETPQTNATFGYSVAAVGSNILVGSRSEDVTGHVDSGAAYLFDGTTGTQLFRILLPSPAANQFFSTGLSALDDGTLLISATTSGFGQVYLIDPSNGAIINVAAAGSPSTLFGGDIYGVSNLFFVGAAFDSSAGPLDGAVYLYLAPNFLFYEFTSPDASTVTNQLFGVSFAIGGSATLAIGAGNPSIGGAVYLYDLLATVFDPSPNSLPVAIYNPTPTVGDGFGLNLAAVYVDLAVGAPGTDRDGVINTGSVYYYGYFDAGLSDLSDLASLENLRWLSLANNEISDIGPLASLSQLEYLNLQDNKIQDISPLVDQFLIDDSDAVEDGFYTEGEWLNTDQPTDATFGDDYLFSDGDPNGALATWDFSNVPNGTYDLQAMWLPGDSRTSDATYHISGVAEPIDVTIDQRVAHDWADFWRLHVAEPGHD